MGQSEIAFNYKETFQDAPALCNATSIKRNLD